MGVAVARTLWGFFAVIQVSGEDLELEINERLEEAGLDAAAFACIAPAHEGGILWSDPDIGIEWPIEHPLLSEKDQTYSRLRDFPQKMLPVKD